jgi:ABC-2 type transport system ATP-binding protein
VNADTALAVQTVELTKRFGRHIAVENLALRVPRGAVFGFLGPNGSGKTTTLRMLLGLAAPSSGTANVLGASVTASADRVLPRIGALVEAPAFYPYLSGAANLVRLDAADRFAPSGSRRARVAAALERVGLGHAARTRVRAYSLGMKQRLGIAAALLRPRELIVLDEPTNGLDPQGTREVRRLIRSLAGGGVTVLVSSHLLSEIEQVCTHAAVMRAGHLVAQGTIDDLRGTGARVRVTTPDRSAAVDVLLSLGLRPVQEPGLTGVAPSIAAVLPDPRNGDAVAAENIVAALVQAGVRVHGFSLERPSLEDSFVSLTGEGFDVER